MITIQIKECRIRELEIAVKDAKINNKQTYISDLWKLFPGSRNLVPSFPKKIFK